jgi:hypothetical protein
MASNNTENKVCITCGDVSGRQVTCNGCLQSFCWTHMTNHQQDILKQMDDCAQNHERLKHDWDDDCHHQQLFHKIDQWEEESINNIRITADTARADLKLLIKRSKDQLQTSIQQISKTIHNSQELNHFSEIDINQWKQQLKYIQSQIQTSFNIQIKEDKQKLPIMLIKIEQKTKRLLDQNEQTVKRSRNETNNDVNIED